MEVIQDLLTLQLESIESTDPLQLSSDETVEDSAWGPGLVGEQPSGLIHRSNRLIQSSEQQQVGSNNAPDGMRHAHQHDIVSPQDIIKTPEFRPGGRS